LVRAENDLSKQDENSYKFKSKLVFKAKVVAFVVCKMHLYI